MALLDWMLFDGSVAWVWNILGLGCVGPSPLSPSVDINPTGACVARLCSQPFLPSFHIPLKGCCLLCSHITSCNIFIAHNYPIFFTCVLSSTVVLLLDSNMITYDK